MKAPLTGLAGVAGILITAVLAHAETGGTSTPTTTTVPPDPSSILQWCGAQADGVAALRTELQGRERDLNERARTIEIRETEIQAQTKTLEARLAELATARKELSDLLDKSDAQHEERVASLVKMVEAGKPSQVGPMIAALDQGLAVEVINRMNQKKAGKLLAALPAPTAARLAERLTRPLPVPGP